MIISPQANIFDKILGNLKEKTVCLGYDNGGFRI